MIAEVIFNLPIERAFDYAVPPDWEDALRPGMRVLAPFGSRRLIGYVFRLGRTTSVARPKTLLRLIDPAPVLTAEAFRLATWLSEHYCCGLGEACASMVPTALRIRSSLPADASLAHGPEETPPTLTPQQQRVHTALMAALQAGRHQTVLLHGVTGSGKTELYLRLIAAALQHGRSAICLVPEIALTPQMIDRFRQRLGPEVAVWHSRLTARQRAAYWQGMASGQHRVVIGTRSAVFAPLARVGVIILDEEHDASYKQHETPRYHARDVALARARMTEAVVVLGSATPSVETYYLARQGRFHLLKLTERVHGRQLPHVEIIDMRQELAQRHRLQPFSQRLQQALRQVTDLQEQAILLLNRRGFARVVQCSTCGTVVRCDQCVVPLVYHASAQQLVCHYCNRRQAAPDMCRTCQRGYLRFRGSGTERIESELHRLFPMTSIARMDRDTTRTRDSHQQLYHALKHQQINVLVGTQMVAKGHDFPQVTLVGVISADTALNLPDFRAGERTFDLLAQVAGRAGRGDRPGRVLIQTFCPTHYAIQAASRHDYEAFFHAEIEMRRRLKLPPFVHLVELTVLGRKREHVQAVAEALQEALEKSRGRGRIAVLGPAPHRLASLRRTFHWRIVLKAARVEPMLRVVRRTLSSGRRFRGLPVIVDVDPL